MDAITYAMSKKYTDSKVSVSTGLHREIVNSLPATGDNNTIYMVLDPKASSPDIYDEWLWVNGAYEHIGSTRVDLTDYYNKTQVDMALSNKANKATTLFGYGITDAYTKTETDTALSSKASTSDIPTTLASLSDDTTHRLVSDTEKNTWNGKANSATTLAGYSIADAYTKTEVDTELGNHLEIQNNAGFHNSIYRGKSLGSSVTAAQQQAIHNGTFEDLFIGDYWAINSVNYRIAAFDYWLNTGTENNKCTSHHAVLVPDGILYSSYMNEHDEVGGAYVNSAMRSTNLATARTIIQNAFGSSAILTHKEYLTSQATHGYPDSGQWKDSDIELMNELMVYGSYIYTPGNTPANALSGELPLMATTSKTQLELFKLNPSLISAGLEDEDGWFLRDVVSTSKFAIVTGQGNAGTSYARAERGVRPCFAITY